MNHIFIAGAYFTTDKNDIDVYPCLATFLKEKYPNKQIIQPIDIEHYRENYIKSHPSATLEQINKAMVEYDLEMVKTSETLIVDITNKSTGLGIELGSILNLNKKLIFIAKQGSKISNMVYGTFPNHKVYFYKNLSELKQFILSLNL